MSHPIRLLDPPYLARCAIAVLAIVVGPVHAQSATVEARLARLERILDSQGLVDILRRLEGLQEEVRELRGEVESMAYQLDTLKQHQRALYVDLDRRLQKAESSSPPAPRSTPPAPRTEVPAQPAPTAPAGPSVSPDPRAEQAAYQKAFDLLKQGNYASAISTLRQFLTDYPAGNYADNAQYWLGEAHYVTRQFREAITEFMRVLEHYPNSPKVPDAMLKIGYIHYELGEWEEARQVLTDLKSRYPKSTAARLADNRLQRMRSEGH